MAKSSSTYREALSLLMEKSPQLALLAPSWEGQEVIPEKIALPSLERIETLYCWGLSDGALYVECLPWLKEKKERKLIFLEEEEGTIAALLQRQEALALLADPQVYIELFSPKKREIAALAERFPCSRIEVVALPSRKRRLRGLRLQLLRQTALAYALSLDRLHGYQPFENFVKNAPHLGRSFYANGLKGAFAQIPAIVCGAGPSLAKSLPLLRQMENRALLIAGGSALAALSTQGILPHFGMAIDPNLEEYRRLKNSFAFEVPLLYSTRVHPAIFQTMNGPFGYMRSGIGGASEIWLEEELGLFDPLIGDFLSPEASSVTAICVAWAQFLGCDPILLDGVDMAYTGNKRYAEGVAQEEELSFLAHEAEKEAADRILKRRDREGNWVYTAVRWVMESASLSYFAKKHPEVKFLNVTDGGIGFQGIPYLPLAEAVRDFPERELRSLVHQKILDAPMPAGSAQQVEAKLKELKKSLNRVMAHLQVLVGEVKGVPALAEMEVKEEIAFFTLFYDIEQVLASRPPLFWHEWLQLARKYAAVLPDQSD